jgi:type IV pilus assembly protein PilM
LFGEPGAVKSGRSIAVIDAGTESTNLVVSSPCGVWFRSFGQGGDTFTRELVKQLQLTYDQAEAVKRDPSKARRFHKLQAAMQPLLGQFASETERSLATYYRLFPDQPVKQIYGLGGAAQTYGLLAYLRSGKQWPG